jgi:FkbM family methyltransferase
MRFQNLVTWLIGGRGGVRRVVFREGDRTLDCLVPDDNLWGAVKDNVLLSEYERVGIKLSDFRGIVIDAGAHVGTFSLRVAPYAREVIALEPAPENFELLRRNIDRNDAGVVRPVARALWHAEGRVGFRTGRHTGAGHLSEANGASFDVETTTLDELVAEAGDVDLLKLDIEGAELAIIEAARPETLERISTIVAELHGVDRELSSALVDRLRGHGFEVTVLDPPISSWRQSGRRLVARWSVLPGFRRLKLAVLLVYAVSALLGRFVDTRGLINPEGLAFVYARRRPAGLDTSNGDGEPEMPAVPGRVSVVVPTRNSRRTLAACLESLRQQTYADVEIVVTDNASTDGTREIAERLADRVLTRGPERSAQRNQGARASSGEFLLFLDSDMIASPELAADVARTFAAQPTADGLILPERATGDGFWAGCKALEKELYIGDGYVEAARAFRRGVFFASGGYDESIHGGGEDWELPERIARAGGAIDRVAAGVVHDEGRVTLRGDLARKYYYGRTFTRYARKDPRAASRKLLRRSLVAAVPRLAREPVRAGGLLGLKALEFAAVAAGVAAGAVLTHPAERGSDGEPQS